ncbi:hypothetical protein AYI69_g11286 [Smittium culicis]|uniref:Uncharacterized protein n=1 Tax=Smittium culicis TaxID=133412 RepID=A0A1R1WZT2_9FUNG|nr:hypothetical protein AYI69_g11286 [Smittium culicis]
MGVDRNMHKIHKSYEVKANRAGIINYQSQDGAYHLSENHTTRYDDVPLGDFLESSIDKDTRPTEIIRETYKCREEVALMHSKLYRKGAGNFSGASTGKINSASTFGAEETILVYECFMDIDCLYNRRSNAESTVL